MSLLRPGVVTQHIGHLTIGVVEMTTSNHRADCFWGGGGGGGGEEEGRRRRR